MVRKSRSGFWLLLAVLAAVIAVVGVCGPTPAEAAETASYVVFSPSDPDSNPTHSPSTAASSEQYKTWLLEETWPLDKDGNPVQTITRVQSLTIAAGDTVSYRMAWGTYSNTNQILQTYASVKALGSSLANTVYAHYANTPSLTTNLPDGMTYVDGSVNVYLKNDNDSTTYSISQDKYTLTTSGSSVTVTFNNLLDIHSNLNSGSIIYVDFSATLTTVPVENVAVSWTTEDADGSTTSGSASIPQGTSLADNGYDGAFSATPDSTDSHVFRGWVVTYADGTTSDVLSRDEVVALTFEQDASIAGVWEDVYVTVVLPNGTSVSILKGSSLPESTRDAFNVDVPVGMELVGFRRDYGDGAVYPAASVDYFIDEASFTHDVTTMVAVYEEKSVTVTVLVEGENDVEVSVPVNGTFSTEGTTGAYPTEDPEAPEGMTFDHWVVTVGEGTDEEASTSLTTEQLQQFAFTADATVEAVFVEDGTATTTRYTVTLPSGLVVVEEGQTIPAAYLPTEPTSTDLSQEFAGWAVTWADGSTVAGEDGTTLVLTATELGEVPITQDATVSAVWNTVTVSVTLPDGSMVTAERGAALATEDLPATPAAQDGKTFAGWQITWADGTTTAVMDAEALAACALISDGTVAEVWEDAGTTPTEPEVTDSVSVTVPAGLSTTTYTLDRGSALSADQAPSELWYPTGYAGSTGASTVWSDHYTFQSWTVTWADGTTTEGLSSEELLALSFAQDATVTGNWAATTVTRADVLLKNRDDVYKVGEDFDEQSAADVADSTYASHLVEGTSGTATVNMFDYYIADENGDEVLPYALRTLRRQADRSTWSGLHDSNWAWNIGYLGGINGAIDVAVSNGSTTVESAENAATEGTLEGTYPTSGNNFSASLAAGNAASLLFGTNGLFDSERANVDNQSHAATTGLVKNKLSGAGYFQLSGTTDYPYYNQRVTGWTGTTSGTYGADTTYLFATDSTAALAKYRRTYTDVQGLFQVDEDGYYYYNSQLNFAQIYKDEDGVNRFALYDTAAVNVVTGEESLSRNGQFFPFNTASEVFDVAEDGSLVAASFDDNTEDAYESTGPKTDKLNHHFGMTMEVEFTQEKGGHLKGNSENDPVTYTFSGDDDVWIYIDGVLVADGGGVHEWVDLSIDFSDGAVYASDATGSLQQVTTIKAAFEAAGVADDYEWSGNTFADYTDHTLKMFYLERGASDSNLSLRYNLTKFRSIEVNKSWGEGTTPEPVQVQLYKDGVAVETSERADAVVTLSSENDWTYTWEHVDEDGTYTVRELTTGNWTATYNHDVTATTTSIETTTTLRTKTDLVVTEEEVTRWESTGNNELPTSGNFLLVTSDGHALAYDSSLETYNVVLTSSSIVNEDGTIDPAVVTSAYQWYLDGSNLRNAGTDSSWGMSDDAWRLLMRSGYQRTVSMDSSGALVVYRHQVQKVGDHLELHNGTVLTFAVYTLKTSTVRTETEVTYETEVEQETEVERQVVIGTDADVTNIVNEVPQLLLRKVSASDQDEGLDGATFSLWQASTDDAAEEVPGTEGVYGTKVSGYDSMVTQNGGYLSLGGLARGTYYLMEDGAPVGYEPLGTAIELVVGDTIELGGDVAGVSLADGVLTVADEPGTLGLQLLKVDADDEDKVLEGAGFDLWLVSNLGTETIPGTDSVRGVRVAQGTTASDGTLAFEGLASGAYYLVETEAPSLHRGLEEPVALNLTPEGVTLTTENGLVSVVTSAEGAAGGQVLRVANEGISATLPLTGGTGVVWLWALGAGLVLVSLLAGRRVRRMA